MSAQHPWNDKSLRWEVTEWSDAQEACKHVWRECGHISGATWKDCNECGAEAWPVDAAGKLLHQPPSVKECA